MGKKETGRQGETEPSRTSAPLCCASIIGGLCMQSGRELQNSSTLKGNKRSLIMKARKRAKWDARGGESLGVGNSSPGPRRFLASHRKKFKPEPIESLK